MDFEGLLKLDKRLNSIVLWSLVGWAGQVIGGEGGIRTHVPRLRDKAISSRPRYGHFGTSPVIVSFG